MTPEIQSRIAKIYELVKRGSTEGEKQSAKAALDKLMAKYDLQDIDLNRISYSRYSFTYTTDLEQHLFQRLVAHVLNDEGALDSARRNTRGERRIYIELQYMDYVTLDASYEYFRRHMKAQWNKVCAPELKKCRKVKTKNARRSQLQPMFLSRYIIESGLFNPDELIPISSKSYKEAQDQMRINQVEGGKYNKQVVNGLYLT